MEIYFLPPTETIEECLCGKHVAGLSMTSAEHAVSAIVTLLDADIISFCPGVTERCGQLLHTLVNLIINEQKMKAVHSYVGVGRGRREGLMKGEMKEVEGGAEASYRRKEE